MRTKNNNPAWLVACFLFLYTLLGLFIYKDYSVSWDEVTSRKNGQINVNHIVKNYIPSLSEKLPEHAKLLPDLDDWKDKDYGVAFEVPVFALEYLIGLKNNRDRYLFRHLMTFLFSLLGVLAIYGIVKKRYGNYSTALLAALLYILSPRIFAESFYNSKDIVFMASFAMAIYTMMCFLDKPGALSAIAHGFVTALAIDIRIMGIIILFATLGVFAIQLKKREFTIQHGLAAAAVYITMVCAFVIAMFPFLWADPLGNFIFALENMAKFRWDGEILYMGEFIRSTDLPWHYAPVWILITTPP
jgi:dolichyl-phosphate-mannose--protein O-mannosyl transferase